MQQHPLWNAGFEQLKDYYAPDNYLICVRGRGVRMEIFGLEGYSDLEEDFEQDKKRHRHMKFEGQTRYVPVSDVTHYAVFEVQPPEGE